MESGQNIADWYGGKSVLVTGGTGFMGKVLIEKLLRSCPQICTIYVLIRPKRGLQAKERLAQLLNLTIFDEVRKVGGLLEKVEALESDATLPALGLTPDQQDLIREKVSVIFHSAATVRFDEPLKEAVAINMTATRSIVQLARTMPKLEAMVHISTAYCNCNRLVTDEQVYSVGRDPEEVIRTVETLDQELLDTVTPRLLGDRPNTYTFTKALAEQIVYEQSGILPIAIVRPSIVVAGWREPIPGWVDNLNGPTGLLVGAGKGVLRTLLCEGRHIADLIPVDMAINFCIAAAWYTATARPNNIVVYHCTTGSENPFYWRNLEIWGQEYICKYPYSDLVWYPGGSFKRFRLTNYIANLLFQRIPAYVFDLGYTLTGNKPVMVRVQDKLEKATKTIEFFTMREFKFNSENMAGVWAALSPEDRELFYFDVKAIDWKPYIEAYVQGVRAFILKEDPSTLPQARQNLSRMYALHCLTQTSIFSMLFWLFFMKSKLTKRFLFTLLDLMLKTVKKLRFPQV